MLKTTGNLLTMEPIDKQLANLIPFNKRTEEEQRRIRRLGGLSRSPAKKLAAQLRWLKESEHPDLKKLYEIMNNPEVSTLKMLLILERYEKKLTQPNDYAGFLKAFTEWHKLRHGDKLIIESTSRNLNVDVMMAVTPARIEEATRERTRTP